MSAADLAAIQFCVDAEIARARLEELISDCCDADLIWIHEVVQEAMRQSARAADQLTAANLSTEPTSASLSREN